MVTLAGPAVFYSRTDPHTLTARYVMNKTYKKAEREPTNKILIRGQLLPVLTPIVSQNT